MSEICNGEVHSRGHFIIILDIIAWCIREKKGAHIQGKRRSRVVTRNGRCDEKWQEGGGGGKDGERTLDHRREKTCSRVIRETETE